jgi:hypothetical protein
VTTDEINDLTASLIREFGAKMAAIGQFETEMVAVEGMVAGLIAFNAVRYNKQPDELVEAFCEGLRERVTRLIYGEKQ